jgi:hypothetical protein
MVHRRASAREPGSSSGEDVIRYDKRALGYQVPVVVAVLKLRLTP